MSRIADFSQWLPLPSWERAGVRGNSALRTPHSKGFTLIEVLLSLAILASVVAAVYASFSTAGQSVASAEAVRADVDTARAFLVRLTDDLVNAYYPRDKYGNPSLKEAYFRGKKVEEEVNGTTVRVDSISLTTLALWRSPGSTESGLWDVGYFFRERQDGTGMDLLRRERKDPGSDASEIAAEAVYELTDKIISLQLRYYDGSKWTDEWDSNLQRRPPPVVEIALTTVGGRFYTTKVETSEFRR